MVKQRRQRRSSLECRLHWSCPRRQCYKCRQRGWWRHDAQAVCLGHATTAAFVQAFRLAVTACQNSEESPARDPLGWTETTASECGRAALDERRHATRWERRR